MNLIHSIFSLGLLAATVVASLPSQEHPASPDLAHTRTEFKFTANASLEQAAPLFGANEERKWAPDWNPQFVYPTPAHDQPGMVFRVSHGQFSSVWINTAFDLAAGHIQYVYVVNDAMTTLIDIHLMRQGADKTSVNVVYERTALLPEANEHVLHFAKGDAKADQEWETQINGYLAKASRQTLQK